MCRNGAAENSASHSLGALGTRPVSQKPPSRTASPTLLPGRPSRTHKALAPCPDHCDSSTGRGGALWACFCAGPECGCYRGPARGPGPVAGLGGQHGPGAGGFQSLEMSTYT